MVNKQESARLFTLSRRWGRPTVLASIAALCGVVHGGHTLSPDSAWSSSTSEVKVFDSSDDGTLGSDTTTQSTSTSAGLSGDVSLEKRGSGSLTVNGVHSFTGNVDIREGIYQVGSAMTDKTDARNSPLGDPRTARTITVYTNATLKLTTGGTFGSGRSSSDVLASLEIRGGTLEMPSSKCTTFGNLLFHNATIVQGGNGQSGKWPEFALTGDLLEFSSDTGTPYVFSPKSNSDRYDYSGWYLSRTKPVEIRVPDITGDADADVTFNNKVTDNYDNDGWAREFPGTYCLTNFIKTGAGTLVLGSMENNFGRDVVVSNGTLKLTGHQARIGSSIKTVLGISGVPHTVYVERGATLWFTGSDHLEQVYNDPAGVRIYVRGGTLKQDDAQSNTFGPLILEDATLEYGKGAWDASNLRWPAFAFSEVTFRGTTAYDLASVDGSYFVFGMNGMHDLRVERIVSDGTYSAATPDVTISSPIHDCLSVWSGNGPRSSTFRKTGPGVLKLANTSNAFTGNVEIDDGVVTLGRKGTNNGYGPTSGALGNLMTNKVITVCGSGELYYGVSDQLGQACADMEASMVVSNGTIRFKSGIVNGLPAVKFYDANVVYGNGVGNSGTGDAAAWGLWAFRYPVTFDGTRPFSLPSRGSNNIISLGYSSDFSEEYSGSLTNRHGKTEFCVRDMTGDPCVDVDIGMGVQSLPYWTSSNNKATPNVRYRCGLLKTGSGTLRLGGTFTCPENTRINEGALVFDGALAAQQSGWAKSTMQVQDGAYLGGTGTVENVVVEEGGGFTSALGHDGALKINGTLTLPQDNIVRVNIVCTNNLETLRKYSVPVVESTRLSGATFVPVFNGGEELPTRLRMQARVRDGVVYGVISQCGLVISYR